MVEHEPSTTQVEAEMATSLVAGGALTIGLVRDHYSGQLGDDPYVPAEERFWPNPLGNVRNHEETYKRFEEFAENVFDRAERQRLVAIGHSFGGFLVVKLGLRRPDLVAVSKSEAGLQEGYNAETISIKALTRLVGMRSGADNGRHDSPLMEAFHEEIASEWSPEVRLILHSSGFDNCFPLPQGLRIDLPEGQKPERRVVGPNVPVPHWHKGFVSMTEYLRSIEGMPDDVEVLHSRFPTEHIFLPKADGEVKHTRRLRLEVAEANKDPEKPKPEEADRLMALAA